MDYIKLVNTGLEHKSVWLFNDGYKPKQMIESMEEIIANILGHTTINITDIFAKPGVYVAHKTSTFHTIPKDIYLSLVNRVMTAPIWHGSKRYDNIMIFITLDPAFEFADVAETLTVKNVYIGAY